MIKKRLTAKNGKRINNANNAVHRNIDDAVNELHAAIKRDAEKELLMDVLKVYDPDYKPIRMQPELFRKASTIFITADGKRISSLAELAHALNEMPDNVFKHHVNQFKHDFSNWAKDSFGEEFADKLRKHGSRKGMREFITNRMQEQLNLLKR